MTPGRNDPCPCGSGKKYKRCCLGKERRKKRAEATFGRHGLPSLLPDRIRPSTVEESPVWEADAIPVPARFEDDPEARPVAVVVMAGETPLHMELLARLGGEAEDVASKLERGVLAAADRAGGLPDRVDVRHVEVAVELSERLEERGIDVGCDPDLFHVGQFGRRMMREVFDSGVWPPISGPDTWAGWGHPDEAIGGLFEAAATFHRAAPWQHLSDDLDLRIEVSGSEPWTGVVLGAAGVEFGLALYEEAEDVAVTVDPFGGLGPPPPLDELYGRVLSLTFDSADEIPRRTRKEVARKGWEVASPSAYPTLIPLNTPGGGLSSRDLADLTAALRAVAELAEHLADGDAPPEEGWWEEVPGARLYLEREITTPPWAPPAALKPGDPEGPNAEPEAGLRRDPDPDALMAGAEAMLDRFSRWLDREKGFGRATVRKHAANAATFCEFLCHWEALPPAAAHERDLRTFLFDWYIRKVMDAETRAEAMPVSLERFFQFLAEEEGVECPWAEDVLSEREAYRIRRETFPGGIWWDSGVGPWIWRLNDDLDRRVMLPDDVIADTGIEWNGPARAGQIELQRELERRWLLWRDEEIRGSTTDPDELRSALLRRQRSWERSPHPEHGGRTPVEVVERERRERR